MNKIPPISRAHNRKKEYSHWWDPDIYQDKIPYLQKRMQMTKAIRGFFDDQDFWEVETPILQVCPTVDTHIHGVRADLRDINLKPYRSMYLHTSPEFAMKKMMVAGLDKIYQICHVFRDGDGGTGLHSPEFTMIEWYRTHAGVDEIIADCINLLRQIAEKLDFNAYTYKSYVSNPFLDWDIITVRDAFRKFADINLDDYLENKKAFAEVIESKGIKTSKFDSWDDLFFRVMVENIEPYLGMDVPTILKDYPVCMAALARKKPEDPRYAERFELYVCGVEVANAFGELTDPKEQRQRFIDDLNEKERIYGERYPIDKDFISALEYGLPESGGIALGIDRLAMLATGADHIRQVLWTSIL